MSVVTRLSVTTALTFFTASGAWAVDGPGHGTDTIVVYGRAKAQIGRAGSASEGLVGYADFEDRPLSRSGELVEVIPGAVATQHSGEGKANQYFLRGFNLDHGTDFAASVDGVPVNLRTHGHGQGYLDLNFVIPELVEQVSYAKGPYHADGGDFSAAGGAAYTTYDDVASSFGQVTLGEDDYRRALLVGTRHWGDKVTTLGAIERQTYDGPWQVPQDLEKTNAFGKWSWQGFKTRVEITGTAYDASWDATDQVPQRAIDAGLIDRFGSLDTDLGGETSRYSLSARADIKHGLGQRTTISAYGVSYDLSLWSNFTYFADDPVNGGEFEQRDSRTYFGGSAVHERMLNDRVALRLGGEVRRDEIDEIGLYKTAGRQRLSTVREDEVTETSAGLWADAGIMVTDRLRANLGLRQDWYEAEVTAISRPVNSGDASDNLLSPSAGLAYRLTDAIELYANYGQGFHSNDVRGTTISVDPTSGDPAETVPLLVRATGAEIGARIERETFNVAVALFQVELDSELVFVGDAGTTEPNDASVRHGVEASAFWRPNDWLTVDAGGAITDAAFDIDASADRISGAVENVFSGGLTAQQGQNAYSLRLRHFGEAPLNEDGSVMSEATTLLNGRASRDMGRLTLSLDVLNMLDAEDADISYFFASQLPREPQPVEDVHFHPVEPRQVRVTARVRF
ncbi:TonB-dependent receptor [Parvularcula sp. LCG005]|uniref:TonB-dependent receptor n=1 Tax=Parvularcula sp. LCG005 TaxID=3078805 RepID=UPI002942BF7B|nr:TonB-dependent receptor [Parvularcula sp. LCG005]WOI54199.1 TonB-dependent receptor [Parvularcula sp. LCG005]